MNKLFPVLAFVAALLVLFLYVNPTYSGSIAAQQAAIAGDDQALTAATQYTQKQNQLISAEKSISPDALTRLSKFLPDSADDVGLILDLDALAAKDGLTLTSINVATGQDAAAAAADSNTQPYRSIDLTLSATGTYGSFRSFLASTEASQRLIDVRNLAIAGSSNGVYNYTMTLRLYWLQ